MGLFQMREAGKSGRTGIWHITESLEELLNMKQFSISDLSVLNTFSYEHRKKEWLVSRILLERLTGDSNLKLIYDDYNKPFLKGSELHISLSHSHDFLAVIIDKKETGIDIELVKPNVLRIKNKFMSIEELRALEKGHKQEELTLYWCVKESLYKLHGKKELAFKNIVVEPFEYLEKGKIRAVIRKGPSGEKYILHYEKITDAGRLFMLAHVLSED